MFDRENGDERPYQRWGQYSSESRGQYSSESRGQYSSESRGQYRISPTLVDGEDHPGGAEHSARVRGARFAVGVVTAPDPPHTAGCTSVESFATPCREYVETVIAGSIGREGPSDAGHDSACPSG
ncbi:MULTISPECIES: hypothetical protein [Halomicrobium]|uniref:Uncharacterized protein n=1 Tax=Halomicrobium mukohataei TaxID=57705 RepID=A0A4D6KNB2_9EURY|nr:MULTISPECIES: hypothetical protein [Halomicrobium]QCD67013.1 hypothetical protein E5139_15675 [Halomicrobium mukohataei]QFR21823.1 hypothetical protein GBQ70_15695 [Halomicrobium sp. ZPS1]